MISHTQIPVLFCVCERRGYAQKMVWLPKTHHFYNRTNVWNIALFCFKHLYWSLVDMYVKLSTSDRDYFLPFQMFFLCGGTPCSQTEVTPCLQCGNHQWCKCGPDVKKWWRLATLLESQLVTWCLWTNGTIGCKRFLMDQSKKGCFALFREKHGAFNGCFILMNCHCQILCVHVALQKSIHFREIFERVAKLRAGGCGPQIALWVVGHRLRVAGYTQVAGCGAQIAGCGLRASFRLQAAGHRLRAADCCVAGCGPHVVGC